MEEKLSITNAGCKRGTSLNALNGKDRLGPVSLKYWDEKKTVKTSGKKESARPFIKAPNKKALRRHFPPCSTFTIVKT